MSQPYPYQPYPPGPGYPSPFLMAIGDIGVTSAYIATPHGTAPLRGSTWTVTDMTVVERQIPTWAIVLAVVFALFCLLGLFFLLVKEDVVRGYVQVWVRSGTVNHLTQIPVTQPGQVVAIRGLVSQAQAMAHEAPEV